MTTVDQELGYSLEKDFAYNNNVANAHVTVRLRFLRKVYGLLFTQLLFTTVCVGSIMFLKPYIYETLQKNFWIHLVLMVSLVAVLIALMYKRMESPINLILLLVFTICESVLLGFVVVTYSFNIVLQAIGLTAVVALLLTLYTFNAKRDFSNWGVGLSVFLLILLLAAPINFFLGSSLLELSFAIGGALLFSLFIIYDTNQIMHHCSPEEYIVACINLYLDILNLFMYILRILERTQNQN